MRRVYSSALSVALRKVPVCFKLVPCLPIKAPHGWEEAAKRTFAMETLVTRRQIIIQLGDVIPQVSVTLHLFPKNLGFLFPLIKHPECLCKPNLIYLTEMLISVCRESEEMLGIK